MKFSVIQRNQFMQWKQLRQAVYSSLNDAFHEQEMEKIFNSPDWFCYFITDQNNRILGLVELSSRNVVDGCLSSPVAYLEGLYLKQEYRGKGLGRETMKMIQSWCQEKGYSELASDSELANLKAQKFFKAVGLKETYQVVQFYTEVNPKSIS